MARTKTHRTSQNTEYTKTQQTLRNNYIFVFFGFFCCFFIFNFQLLKGLLQKKLNYRLGTVNKNIGGLNQFSAAANLTLSQHFLEMKKEKKCPFVLFNKATKE